MKQIMIQIPLEPKGKARHRMTKTGKTYTPKDTIDFQESIREEYVANGGIDFGSSMICANIIFVFQVPKTKMKKYLKRELFYKKSKPDLDNLLKAVLDALNGLAYKDDSQVVLLSMSKIYGLESAIKLHLKEVE